jgi:MPBQ/MSBQ methyltransferase
LSGRPIDELLKSVTAYIRRKYEGVFSDVQMERHFRDYVELDLSEGQLSQLQEMTGLSKGKQLVDLGCGFGSFVFVCRKAGIEAVGVDFSKFEIDFARRRLTYEIPELDPESVYLLRDACATQFESQSYDVVTAWNLLEHVADYKSVFIEAYRLLKPGGMFFGIAPNYFTFRKEAHYHVPWVPFLPRRVACNYLRWLGRQTDFFEHHIHYVTNWGILRALRKQGFKRIGPALYKVGKPELVKSTFWRHIVNIFHFCGMDPFLRMIILTDDWNPFKGSVYFAVRKI